MKTVQPRKQRKLLYQAPFHIRHKHFSAPLSASLKTTYSKNAIPLRKGDTVRVMRGERKGTEGKVARIDSKNYQIYVEGITREKVDGSTTLIPIHPSKVMVTNLNLDDKWRKEIMTNKTSRKERKTAVKTEKEPAKEETVKPQKKIRKRIKRTETIVKKTKTRIKMEEP